MITADAPPPPLQMLAHPMVASFALSTPYRVATANMMKHISSDYTMYIAIRKHTRDGTGKWKYDTIYDDALTCQHNSYGRSI